MEKIKDRFDGYQAKLDEEAAIERANPSSRPSKRVDR